MRRLEGFEQALEKVFGESMRVDEELCKSVWSALANIEWEHPKTGESYSCSFRCAGGLISEIINEGSYMDWYCCATAGVVSSEIEKAMKECGWVCEEIGAICND